MADAVRLSGAIGQLVAGALRAAKLSEVSYGTVTSENPLEIMTDQKVRLFSSQLTLSRNVTDYEADIELSAQTEPESGGSGDEAFSSHRHQVRGKKKIKVLNALKTGDRVVLVRLQSSQERIVLDRIAPKENLNGEWML